MRPPDAPPIRCTQPMLTAAEIRWSMTSPVEEKIRDIFDPNIIDTVAVRSELVRPVRALLPSREPGEDG